MGGSTDGGHTRSVPCCAVGDSSSGRVASALKEGRVRGERKRGREEERAREEVPPGAPERHAPPSLHRRLVLPREHHFELRAAAAAARAGRARRAVRGGLHRRGRGCARRRALRLQQRSLLLAAERHGGAGRKLAKLKDAVRWLWHKRGFKAARRTPFGHTPIRASLVPLFPLRVCPSELGVFAVGAFWSTPCLWADSSSDDEKSVASVPEPLPPPPLCSCCKLHKCWLEDEVTAPGVAALSNASTAISPLLQPRPPAPRRARSDASSGGMFTPPQLAHSAVARDEDESSGSQLQDDLLEKNAALRKELKAAADREKAAADREAALRSERDEHHRNLHCQDCKKAPRDVAFWPCKHSVLCGSCYEALLNEAQTSRPRDPLSKKLLNPRPKAFAKCPECDQNIQALVPVFLA